MPLMSLNVLSGISDRISAQANLLKFAINSGMGTRNGTGYYQRIHQGADQVGGDFFLENSFINDANTIDNNTVSGTLFKSVFSSFIQDLDTYFIAKGFTGTDQFIQISGITATGTLQGQSNNLGAAAQECNAVHVPANFEDVYFQVKGVHLSAASVFFPQDNILVASYVATGSGTGTFTSNNPIGTGAGSVSATNHAAARMMLITSGNMGAAAAQVSLYLSAPNLAGGTNPAGCNILLPASTISGIQTAINTSGQYLNVTNMIVAGGTVGDGYQVWAIKEREQFL